MIRWLVRRDFNRIDMMGLAATSSLLHYSAWWALLIVVVALVSVLAERAQGVES